MNPQEAAQGTTGVEVPFGHGRLRFEVPGAALGEVVGPRRVEPADDPDTLLQRALDRPIGAPRLDELAQPGQRVAILVDDNTRETPIPQMLPTSWSACGAPASSTTRSAS